MKETKMANKITIIIPRSIDVKENEIGYTWGTTIPPGIYTADYYDNDSVSIFFQGHIVKLETTDYENFVMDNLIEYLDKRITLYEEEKTKIQVIIFYFVHLLN
jgi:hypothetical protein